MRAAVKVDVERVTSCGVMHEHGGRGTLAVRAALVDWHGHPQRQIWTYEFGVRHEEVNRTWASRGLSAVHVGWLGMGRNGQREKASAKSSVRVEEDIGGRTNTAIPLFVEDGVIRRIYHGCRQL
jgi:hypothetical protein